MKYELAKELKDAGFPQREANGPSPHNQYTGYGCGFVYPAENGQVEAYVPTLEELIEACGDISIRMGTYSEGNYPGGMKCYAICGSYEGFGMTLTEAVARLWLALNKK